MTINIAKAAAEAIDRIDTGNLLFNATTGGGNIFVDVVPPKPDACISVTILGGTYETAFGGDLSRIAELQIRSRGKTISEAWDLAVRASYALNTTSKGGTWGTTGVPVSVRHCVVSMPSYMNVDANDHPEYVLRVQVRYIDA